MKIPKRAISYLNDTLHDRWSFPHVINLIKEELSLNNEDSFSLLDRILKKDFAEAAKANEWKTKWKSLIKQYEKTKETGNEANNPAYNLNVNTANNMFNNYQGSQTIHSTFTDNSSSVSKMPTSEPQPSTTTPDMNNTNNTSDALSSDEVEDDNVTTNAGLFKKEIYKAAYRFFKGEHDLFSVATLNRLSVSLTPRTLSDALDLFSYHLLSKEMTASEKNVLKLSISHIICFSGPTASIFKAYFDKQSQDIKNLYEQARARVSQFSAVDGLSDNANKLAESMAMPGDETDVRQRLAQKKVDLLQAGLGNTEEMQVLDVIESLVVSLKRKKQQHNSELAYYRVTASLLDIILNDASLQMIDGENCSQATKDEQQNIQRAFEDEDDKKRKIGSKIDLIVSDNGCELSSSEWKREQTSGGIIEQQHAKNIRTNVAMLKKMLSICDGNVDLCVVGMEWLGFVGCAYSIEKHGDVFVMADAGALVIPSSLGALPLMVDTVKVLYKIKHHHQQLAATMELALEAHRARSQLIKLRSATQMEQEDRNPIFFTPTNKRQKK